MSAYYHDSAACLVVDGIISSAAQEERFTRIKHDANFPIQAIRYCLTEAGIKPIDLDYIVFYDKPFLKFERLFETYLAFAPKGFKSFSTSLPVWIKDKLFQKSLILNALSDLLGEHIDWSKKLLFSEHHLSHAASAFFPSPFKDAAVLTMDGVGEWTTTSLALGNGNSLEVKKEIHFPHSLGLLYSAFTYFTGFKVNSGEYKVMGLAPYGVPKYANIIKDHLIDIREDGSFHLDMDYFNYCTDLAMTNFKFDKLFGGPARKSSDILTQREMDLAASIQLVTEEVVIKLATNIRKETGQKNLCLAGGVALNCVANSKLLRENIFDAIWIQPASGDAGGAIGAALGAYYLTLNQPRNINPSDSMSGSYLGPEFSQKNIEERLRDAGANFIVASDEDMISQTAEAIVEGKAVGWHQGRMEFGPRALGNRSIIADPRSPTVQKQLNLKVKYRESFRPFAPSILQEDVSDWFDINVDSPYMLMVANVTKEKQLAMTQAEQHLFGIEKLNIPRSSIPAVTHVDYSARIQTVDSKTNPRFHRLLTKFKELTGCSVLVNTSFNIRGEPIVNSPEEAFQCLMGTGIEFLVVGNCILRKEQQNPALLKDYRGEFELD
ncbi:MAG: carbamoyltransferase [Polynucleobacter sp.]|nr:carbamoyltransferase [Polynucleobacter sp.]